MLKGRRGTSAETLHSLQSSCARFSSNSNGGCETGIDPYGAHCWNKRCCPGDHGEHWLHTLCLVFHPTANDCAGDTRGLLILLSGSRKASLPADKIKSL